MVINSYWMRQTREESVLYHRPGGVVTSGMVMYDTMLMIPSPVSTIWYGPGGHGYTC